jgi:hypothetical protein
MSEGLTVFVCKKQPGSHLLPLTAKFLCVVCLGEGNKVKADMVDETTGRKVGYCAKHGKKRRGAK